MNTADTFTLAGVVTAAYCGVRSWLDFREKRLVLGVWGTLCAAIVGLILLFTSNA